MKAFLKKILIRVQIVVLKIFSSNSFASSFYYFMLSPALRREHHAVLKGKLKYFQQNVIENEPFYLLRRNIHRLEKGLIMKNRRPLFAMEYIEETLDAYVKVTNIKNTQEISSKNFKWYNDVLENYFSVVDQNDPKVKHLKEIFDTHKVKTRQQPTSVPFKRDFNLLEISYDNFFNLTKLRRAVRWYEDRKVPRELIDKAIAAAALSPSACNRQPFEFRVYDDYDLVQKVASITWGTRGFHQNFPAIIVVLGKLEAYFDERDRHVIYVDASLAAMTLMYALETLNLSSCPINWPDVAEFERNIRDLLGLEMNERPVMLISVGYPDKEALVPFSEKKELFEIRSYNKLNEQ